MSEKTLLVEIEKEQKQMVEKQFALAKQKKREEQQEKALKEGKKINIFSAATFPETKQPQVEKRKEEEQEIAKLESKVSSVIEKPNYDYLETLSEVEREKVFKIEKEEKEEVKPKSSRIKKFILPILLAIFGVWGIVNIAMLDNLSSSLIQAETTYNLNLGKYIKNLAALDATSAKNMENLLPIVPDQEHDASEIIAQSNWFDRICNFIGGLFGG